jgi:flagellar basal-body rod protein FlgB
MKLMESVERLRAGLDYHFARHNLLTSNLAHVDTPGYRPKDLERHAAFEGALSSALQATDPHHFGTAGHVDQGFRVINDPGAEPGLDGNAVSIDREAAKIAANNIRYETLATMVGSDLSGLLWAANDGRNG